MSDRLTELQRQRALIQEQLAWIEREIARESTTGKAPSPLSDTPRTRLSSPLEPLAVPASTSGPQLVNPAHDAAAERILDDYRTSPKSIKSDVTKGCFLYFFAAFAAVGLVVAALYFAFRR